MTACIESDDALFFNEPKKLDISKNYFHRRWWYQGYEHQHIISRAVEHCLFYKITIVLLIIDCIVIVSETLIDYTKVKSECLRNGFKYKHQTEIILKVLHYMSISILTLFIFELFIKMYGFGRDFWNIHKRKMEYFDGFIVIFSYIIEIYYLEYEDKIYMKYRSEMITSVRIWRIIRIINSAAQCVLGEEQKKKDHLNSRYMIVIEQLIDLLKYKSDYIEKSKDGIDQHFNQIDTQCQTYFDLLNTINPQVTSSSAIIQFSEQLETLKSSICN